MSFKRVISRLFLVVLLGVGIFARAEFAKVTEENLVAGRFVELPEHLRNAGYFNEEGVQTRGETFEDVVVAAVAACQESINVYSFGMTSWSDACALYFAVLNKHPELFWVKTAVGGSSAGGVIFSLKPVYITTNPTTIASQQMEIDEAREQALAMVHEGASDLEKVLILHDYLATHCDYDTTLSRTNTRNIYGALVERSVVCAGYVMAYEYLLSYVGVASEYVASDAMDHAWNIVTLDGQKYHVDVTWDDPVFWDDQIRRNYVSHENFLLSDNGIRSTIPDAHTGWTGASSPALDTHYDAYFWQAVEEQIPCINGKGYAFDSKDLKQYVLSTGVSDKTLLRMSDKWKIWGGSGSYTGVFSSVIRFGTNLIYSTPTGFRLYDLAEDASKELPTVSCSTSSGYIYGLQHESVNLIAAKIAQSPDDIGNYTDIPLYPVTGIGLPQSSLSLKAEDDPVTLTATVEPSNATYPEIRWNSSDVSVATVVGGVVTPVGLGTADITATTKDGAFSAICHVTVGILSNSLILQRGWNLVAFQRIPANPSQFDGLDFFIAQNGQFVQTSELTRNQAYWVHSEVEQTIVYDCDEAQGGCEITLGADWQFIGISDDVPQISPEAVECWEWTEGKFRRLDSGETLKKGHGYLMRLR